MPPTAQDFEEAIRKIFDEAERRSDPYVIIVSGDLHRKVGSYPSSNHRMPVCCGVMKRMMQPGDEILQSPPSGQGATLKIRYNLPK